MMLSPAFRRTLAVAGFALLIFGAKLALIGFAGSDLPVLDQWDGEADKVLQPYVEGRLTFADLFAGHNEHRIVTTKLYVLALFAANGQWSAHVETTANAAIHTAAAVVLLLLGRRWLSGGWLFVHGVVLLAFFALPFAWENTLQGFQVQFYLLLLFSLGHVVWGVPAQRFQPSWFLGQVCGLLGLFTMASGLLSSLAIVAALAWQFYRERRLSPPQMTSVVWALALIGTGVAASIPVPGHASLHARDAGQFLAALLQLLGWPGPAWLPLTAVPAIWFVVRLLRARRKTSFPFDPVLTALLAWSLLQCAALAYARGNSAVTASRYLDLLVIPVALGWIFIHREFHGRSRTAGAGLWLLALGAGLTHESLIQWSSSIAEKPAWHRRQEANVRDYLRTGDPAFLAGKTWPDLPYPDPVVLRERLDRPAVQSLLPPSVRRPVTLLFPDDVSTTLPPELGSSLAPVAASTFGLSNDRVRHWRSAMLPESTLPGLRFRVAGEFTDTLGLELSVHSATATVPVDLVPPDRLRWRTSNVFRPPGPWWIETGDAAPEAWFAYTAPVEFGRWTWVAEKLLKNGVAVLFAGMLLLTISFLPRPSSARPLP